MKEKLKGVAIGLLMGALLTGGISYAANRAETIDVFYDNIKIFIDGEELDPRDGDGQKVEPFIYNGTTYLPVRAVGQAVGKSVEWDGVEKVVYLCAKPGNAENWLDVCGPYQYKECKEYRLTNNEYFTMSGKKYTNGYTMYLWNPARTAEALYNLDGRFNSVSFTVGHIDDTTRADAKLNVYLDGIIAYTKELKYDDLAQKVTIPLNGALQMKIELVSEEPLNTYDLYYGISDGKFE